MLVPIIVTVHPDMRVDTASSEVYAKMRHARRIVFALKMLTGHNVSVILDSWAILQIALSIIVPATHVAMVEHARAIRMDTTVPVHQNGKVKEEYKIWLRKF